MSRFCFVINIKYIFITSKNMVIFVGQYIMNNLKADKHDSEIMFYELIFECNV